MNEAPDEIRAGGEERPPSDDPAPCPLRYLPGEGMVRALRLPPGVTQGLSQANQIAGTELEKSLAGESVSIHHSQAFIPSVPREGKSAPAHGRRRLSAALGFEGRPHVPGMNILPDRGKNQAGFFSA